MHLLQFSQYLKPAMYYIPTTHCCGKTDFAQDKHMFKLQILVQSATFGEQRFN